MNVWELNLALSAWQSGRALQNTGRQLAVFSDDLWIICPLAMAGEDPSLHAVLLGPRGQKPQLLVAPDPRSPRSRLEMLSRLYKVLGPHVERCLAKNGALPQLVVPSSSAADVLLGLADWLPYLQDQEGKKLQQWTEDARALGTLFQLYSQRSRLTGQQLLLSASGLLDEHFAFGQELRGHLGAQLVWINPPEDEHVALCAARAEALPMGAKTDAHLDLEQLSPALDGWSKVERGGSRSLASFRRQEIEDLLLSVLDPIYLASSQAIDCIEGLGLRPLKGLDELWERDVAAFERHMQRISEGGRFSRRDSTSSAAYGLAESEDALEQWRACRLWDDPLSLAQARVDGAVLHGVAHLLPAQQGSFLVLETDQRWLRVRIGDELHYMQGSAKASVESMVREGDKTKVLLSLSGSGHQIPQEDELCDFASAPADWFRLASQRGNLSRALQEMPTTHSEPQEGESSPPSPAGEEGDLDPLQMVEELR